MSTSSIRRSVSPLWSLWRNSKWMSSTPLTRPAVVSRWPIADVMRRRKWTSPTSAALFFKASAAIRLWAIPVGQDLHVASEPKQNTSVWLALRNPTFVGLWLPSVVSGVCVAAHDMAATWLMNALGASPFLLSRIATAASLPFFLFTLPAGALADLSNRRNLLIAVYLW